MPRKTRSPSFPFISLPVALERARGFYEKEHRHETEPEVAVAHWGYSPRSSGGNQTLAALRAFGLLEVTGEGKVRLTERALGILLDEREESPEREELMKQAARSPALHSRILERYKGVLPSDATLRHYLLVEERFNENSVDDFIAELKETLESAGIERAPERPSLSPVRAAAPAVPPPPPEPEWIEARFPLPGENEVQFRIRQRIASGEADRLRSLFDLWLEGIEKS